MLWLVAIAAGIAVFLPTFRFGFFLDDYHHLAILEKVDPQSSASWWDLWSWADEGTTTVLGDDPQGGWLPWYTAEDLRIAFLRPLSSLVHGIDHELYGRNVVGWRLTSLAIWLALLAAVGGLYRELDRLDGGSVSVAPFALLLFAVDEAHAWNLGWLATRHSLLATLMVVLTVLGHLRWRRLGHRFDRAFAVVALAVGLGCSEHAIAGLAWLVAAEGLMARKSRSLPTQKSRTGEALRALAPFIAIMAVYVMTHKAMGFGVQGLTWYLDPLQSPLRFLAALPVRLTMLLMGLLTPVPAQALLLGHQPAIAFGGALLIVAVIAMAMSLWRRPAARFVTIAVLLSLPVAAISPPFDYMLLLPSVGVMWLVASFLRSGLTYPKRAGILRRLAAFGQASAWILLLVVHLVVPPLRIGTAVDQLPEENRDLLAMIEGADIEIDQSDLRVVIFTTGSDSSAFYLPLAWQAAGVRTPPKAVWVLSSAWGKHVFHRTSATGFELTFPGAGAAPSLWDQAVHDPSRLRAGLTRHQGGLTVTVAEVAGTSIRRIEVDLDRPLDAPSVRLLTWNGQRLERVSPPPIGDEVAVGPHPILGYLRQLEKAAAE